jgi:protein gp37
MSDNTGIEWTDRTWNPVTGCDRVSPGCDHCYALTLAARLKAMGNPRYQRDGQPPTSGPGFGVTVHADKANDPLRWREPSRVFVNSMSDLFHAHIPDEWIVELFAVMAAARRHTFQVLTKRPKRMRDLLNRPDFEARVADRARGKLLGETLLWEWPAPNIWLGTSVEDQQRADLRIPLLEKTPAAVRFLSVEPLLGPVDLSDWLPTVVHPRERLDAGRPYVVRSRLHWIIVGGESGPGHRPMQLDWVRQLRDQAEVARVAFFFKQWGGRTPKAGGRLLDGRSWDEYPRVDGSQVVRVGHRVSPEASDRALQLRLGLP